MKIRTAVRLNYKSGKTEPVWHETTLLENFIGMIILKNDLELIMQDVRVCCAGSGQTGQSKVHVTKNTVIGMDTYNRLCQIYGQSAVENFTGDQVYRYQREHNRITSACGNFFRRRYTLAKTLAMNVTPWDLMEWSAKYGIANDMRQRIAESTELELRPIYKDGSTIADIIEIGDEIAGEADADAAATIGNSCPDNVDDDDTTNACDDYDDNPVDGNE
jgi:hypothetical protein